MNNWQIKKVQDCLEKIPSIGSVLSSQNLVEGKFPIIDQGQDFIAGYTNDESLVFSDCLPVVIFGDHTRALKFIDFPFTVGADGTKILKPTDEFNPKFFYYMLKSIDLGNRGYARHFKLLKESEIPFPSLKTQKEIVAKLDEKFTKLRDAKRLREEALVDAEKILTQTLHEIFEEGKQKGWKEVELKQVTYNFQYGSSKKSLNDGEIPCLRMGNLQNSEIDWGNLKYAPKDEDIKKFLLEKDDLLFNRTNSPELVGKTSIYRGERPAVFAGYLIRINYDRSKVLGSYLNYCLNSDFAKEFCLQVKTDGVSQSNINAQKLAKFVFPFPALSDQQEIVTKLDELSEKIKTLRELQTSQLADLKHLEKSYLREAFRGELL